MAKEDINSRILKIKKKFPNASNIEIASYSGVSESFVDGVLGSSDGTRGESQNETDRVSPIKSASPIKSVKMISGQLVVKLENGQTFNVGSILNIPGEPGPGIKWKDTWASGNVISYAKEDAVFYNGSSYIALVSNPTGTPGASQRNGP